jgi:hypothetical protein
MALPIKLSDVVEQLPLVSDDSDIYLNIKTGEFVVLSSDETFGFDEEDDFADDDDDGNASDQPEWMKEEKQVRREVLESDDYIQLPDKFDIHDWQIMEEFCLSLRRADIRDELRDLIRGRGAFGRFNSAIGRLRLENDWYDFRNKAYEQIALDWLETNEIPFIRDSQSAIADEKRGASEDAAMENKSRSATAAERIAVPHQSKGMRHDKVSRTHEPPDTNPPEEVEPKKRFNENEIKVFISHRESKCDECGEELGRQAWITLEENKGALCLTCADLDELVFLPTGNAALTRRSKKYSTLSAVVLKFSRARRRYERQGLLVEESALAQAEAESLADSEVRERRNERARERRAELDEEYVREFAKRIQAMFPNCPEGREQIIAEHACLKYSGRVGRSAAAKSFAEEMIRLAVMAHVRHRETNYDSLLAKGWFRGKARGQVKDRVEAVLEEWRD